MVLEIDCDNFDACVMPALIMGRQSQPMLLEVVMFKAESISVDVFSDIECYIVC